MKNSIQLKVLGTIFICLAVLFAVIMTFTYTEYRSIEEYDNIVSEEMVQKFRVEQVAKTYKDQIQDWKNALIRGTGNPQELANYQNKFVNHGSELQTTLDTMIREEDTSELITAFTALQSSYKNLMSQYQEGFAQLERSQDMKAIDSSMQGKDKDFNEQLSRVLDSYTYLTQKSKDLKSSNETTIYWSIGSIFAVFLLSFIGVGMLLNKIIIKEVSELSKKINNISQGVLSNTFKTYKHNDEIAQLSTAASMLQTKLAGIFKEFEHSVVSLKQSTETLNSNARTVNQGAEKQSANSNQIATAINEMSATSMEVAKTISDVSQEMTLVNNSINESIASIRHVNGTVANMQEGVKDTQAIVEGLNHEIVKINKIVEVINTISDQTNLLALNAAIEAARAGEYGRGFAVVADEVRGLAKKTQASTREIEEIIKTIINQSHQSVASTDKIGKLVASTSQLIANVEKEINDIGIKSEIVNEKSIQIAAASEEQSQVAEELTHHVVEVSDIADSNLSNAVAMVEISDTIKDNYNTIDQQIKSFLKQA